MTLVESVLALLTSSAPLELRESEQARLRPVAEAIVGEAMLTPIVGGDEVDTAAALVVIASHESGMRESVRRCAVKGDKGQSIGLFQVKGTWGRGGYSVEDVCSSDDLQVRLALRALRIHRERGVKAIEGLFAAYASGSAGRPSKASREMAASFRRMRARLVEATQ